VSYADQSVPNRPAFCTQPGTELPPAGLAIEFYGAEDFPEKFGPVAFALGPDELAWRHPK
jgi:hypothetical protein